MFRFQFPIITVAAFALLSIACARAQQPLPAEGDEAKLLEVLQSDAPIFDKAKACQRLAVIGSDKAVPVLAELLANEELSHYARFGLETNPSADVDAAFRSALDALSGKPLVGVINSIGARRDADAVKTLTRLATGDNEEIAAAATAALGKIASPAAVTALIQGLEGKESRRVTVADACLTAADTLLRAGDNSQAAKVISAVRRADLPTHIDVATRFAEIRLGTGNLKEQMVAYLQSKDQDLFRIGLELAHDIDGEQTTQLLLTQLASLPKDRKVLVMYVLGARKDIAALPAIMEAANDDEPEIRIAAIRVLATLGNKSAVPLLLKFAVSDEVALANAARDSLAELDGDGVNAVVIDRLAKSNDKERVVLVEVAGRRGITDAVPVLLRYAASGDAELRKAAIEALGMTVSLKELPPMVDRLIGPSSTDTVAAMEEALRKACQRMPDRDTAADILLKRVASASPAAKIKLMDLLVYVGGEKALAGAGAAGQSANAATADAATRALGKWLTPDAGPVLLGLAKSGNDQFKVRSLRGYIRIIRQFGLPNRQRLQMSKEAFSVATRDEERKLVLDTLTRFPSPAALNMIVPHLNTPTLKDDACKAAVAIGEKIVDTNAKQVAAAMPKVIAATDDQDITSRAKVLVERANASGE